MYLNEDSLYWARYSISMLTTVIDHSGAYVFVRAQMKPGIKRKVAIGMPF